MIKRIHFFFTCILLTLTACNSGNPEKNTNSVAFELYRDRFIEQYFNLQPGAAIWAGNHDFDDRLVIPDSIYAAQVVQFCEAHLDSLKQFKDDELNDAQRTDLWMLRDQLNSLKWYNQEFRAYEWMPSNWNIAGECAEIINGRYAPLDTRLRSLSKRLINAEAYYVAAKNSINRPTQEHTELAIIQHEGSVEEVFGKSLLDSVAVSGLSETEKSELNERIKKTKSAMSAYSSGLKELTRNFDAENTRSFRIGKELYDRKFEHDLVSGYKSEEIYKYALERRKVIHGEMAALSRQLWPKYFGKEVMPTDSLLLIRKVIDTLSVKHVTPDSFLVAIEKQIPELEKFVSAKNLIYIDPSKPLRVRKTPGYMEGSGAGVSISSPGPYDKNANTYYNVSPLTGYSPEEAESFLREYNQYILQILNIHEAIPGHYTQLVYSNNSPSLVKSIFGNGAMIEGWAVYGERMMLENGYGNNEPEMWLMYYKWHLRTVCNTILDYSVHVLNMEEAEARKLLIDGAFQQTAEADGKWRRVKLSQVQLCSYFNGYTEIYNLRSEIQKRQGSAFDLKKFHEQFLSYGSAPVKYIRDLMLAETK
jgi:hypothetical protein